MRIKAVTLGFVLAGTALGSSALNLGRARGAAWIGQPLELQVPVQLDSGQTDGTLCAEVDVFHGDSRQDANRIQLQTEPTGQTDTFNLKITSSVLIDEPVVTVYLRAGCGQKSSRKYVLLADFPSDAIAPQARVVPLVAPPQVPNVIPVAESAPDTNASNRPSATIAIAATPKKEEASKPAKPLAAKEAPKEVAKEQAKEAPPAKKEAPAKPVVKAEKSAAPARAQPKPAGKPRLRLDPVETLTERVKTLEATTTQSSLQDDLARDSQKMQQLQTDLRTLLDQAVKNEASLAAMRERLEKAEADRVPVAVVYGLVGLVALCMAALAYLWTRRGRSVRWGNAPDVAVPVTPKAPNAQS